ncbi:MAG: hypothetical protein M3453_18700, partial [Pseudomonadota bacterium]|nr:hypothetical protein [Pseudomonadota bacterium]
MMSNHGGDDDEFSERRPDRDRDRTPRRGGQREIGTDFGSNEFGGGGGGGFGDRPGGSPGGGFGDRAGAGGFGDR